MKTKNLLFGLGILWSCLLLGSNSKAQSPNWLWAKSTGNSYTDYAIATATDSLGNIYVTGSFDSNSIKFGTTTLNNAGMADIFLVKYDANGNVIWAKSAGGNNYDNAISVTTDPSGNVYLVGDFESTSLTFGSTKLINSGTGDLFIVKYSSSGSVIWAKSANAATPNSVTSDLSGNIYMTGQCTGNPTKFDTFTLNYHGNGDIFTVKYNANGKVLWAKNAGGGDGEQGNSVRTDIKGNVYVTGYFGSTSITFGTTTLNNSGNADMFIVKYNTTGNVIWAKCSTGGTYDDIAISVATDTSGNAYVVGHFDSPTLTFGLITINRIGSTYDIFVVKYDALGNVIWAKREGGSDRDAATSVVTDSIGNIIVAGVFYSPTLTFGTTTLTQNGDGDLYLVKYNKNGTVIWAKSAGGDMEDLVFSSAIDYSDNIIIAGSFKSSSIIFGPTTLTRIGGSDIFVAKLSSFTGIESLKGDYAVNIYPNPTTGKFTVKANSNKINAIDIYNILGMNIYHFTGQQLNQSTIDLSSQDKGFYFVKISMGNHFYVEKILLH